MTNHSILRLVDTPVKPDLSQSEGYFAQLLARPGVHNVAYIAVNLPKASRRNYVLRTSYPNAWAQHYAEHGYLAIDPAMKRAMNSLMPFDWAELRSLTPAQRQLFGESREFGVGEHGLSIPLRSKNNAIAVVSITANLSLRNWQEFKREKLGEIRLLAGLFNAGVMRELGEDGTPQEVVLTDRETECLRWCAEGKTFEEIAAILAISPRTVRFFLDNARRKLNCLNIVQTVVTALRHGFI